MRHLLTCLKPACKLAPRHQSGDLTMRIQRGRRGILAAILLAVSTIVALADDGVSKDKILFGQVAALNGPAQALGQGMREGILAAFDEANRSGGINGRKL